MTKPCNKCGKDIELVKTANGWKPFNPGDLTPHVCNGTGTNPQYKPYSGPKTDPIVIARQSSLKVAADIVLSGENCGSRPADVVTEDIISIARILTKFVQEG